MPDALTDRMVFLVGAPRNGTNWLQGMLASPPDIVVQMHRGTAVVTLTHEKPEGGRVHQVPTLGFTPDGRRTRRLLTVPTVTVAASPG